MTFGQKYTLEMQTEALDLLRKAQNDGMSIMQACELVAALLDNDEAGRPKPERLRKWAKEAGLFPGSDLRLRYGPDKRARAVAAVEQLVAAGDTTSTACERVAAQEGASFETVRTWYYRRRGDESPAGASAVKATALDLLRDARAEGLPMLAACKQVAAEFTDGPAVEQVRDWALEEGIYTGADRAYSPEFRERAVARLADLIEAGATPTAAAQQLAGDERMPSWVTLHKWFKAPNSEDAPEDAEEEEEIEIEYVDLDEFRATVEAPLREEINRLLVERSLHRDSVDAADMAQVLRERVGELERQNERLSEELSRLRALVRHYIDVSGA